MTGNDITQETPPGIAGPIAHLAHPTADLTPYSRNPRRGNLPVITESLQVNGQYRPIVANRRTGQVLAGNHTLAAAQALGWAQVAVTWVDVDDEAAARIVAVDNRSNDLAEYDDELLAGLLSGLPDLAGTGYSGEDLAALLGSENPFDGPGDGSGSGEAPTLADRFLLPPFDVLDARAGWWQERKRRWLDLGIRSELGREARLTQTSPQTADMDYYRRRSAGTSGSVGYSRDEETGLLLGSASGRDPTYYAQKTAAEAKVGRTLTPEEFESDHYQPSAQYETGTSIFDPVLCEIAYRWFSAHGHTVLDPFAGGSVRGILAAMLGRRYIGNDLSGDQIGANEDQASDFARRALIDRADITWTIGDSADWVQTLPPASADLIFTCPPYLWLEKYSDDPADLSTLTAADFEATYTDILAGAAAALRPNRYAVIVVGDVRDQRGALTDLRGMTIRACTRAGLTYQTGGVLVTPVGSLAVRSARSFLATRVLGRTHQDVLVFVKGRAKDAAQACGHVEVASLDEWEETDT